MYQRPSNGRYGLSASPASSRGLNPKPVISQDEASPDVDAEVTEDAEESARKE